MDTKDASFRFNKAIEESGQFTGYGAFYGNEDLGGDVIKAGAFASAIARQPAGGYPLLWSHDSAEPLGFAKVSDSRDGLVVNGEIDREDPAGERAYRRIKRGIVRGLSIGYTVPRDEGSVSYSGDYRVRTLHKIFLHEVSLVVMPMNPEATITNVKDVAGAVAFLSRVRDVDAGVLHDLRTLQKHLAAILPAEHTEPDEEQVLLQAVKELAAELQV